MTQDIVDYAVDTIEEINSQTSQVGEILGMTEIMEMLKYQNIDGGKKLRPLLCVLVSDFLGGNHDAAICFANGVELAHQASLIHDDIVDGDIFRRKQISLHEKFGIGKALLAGDAVLSLAVRTVTFVSPGLLVGGMKALSKAWMEVSQGAFAEHMHGRDITKEKYYAVIRHKTACLYRAAAHLGAIAAGEEELEDSCSELGEQIGLAFQITDDLSDVLKIRNSDKLAGDMSENKVTMPFIVAKQKMPESPLLIKYLSGKKLTLEECKSLVQELESSGVLEDIQSIVKGHIERAKAIIEDLSDIGDSDYYEILLNFPEYAVSSLLNE